MDKSDVEEKIFEVYFKNSTQPVRIRAQEYQLVTAREEQVIQFFQPGGVLLLHVYVQPSEKIRVETLPVPASESD